MYGYSAVLAVVGAVIVASVIARTVLRRKGSSTLDATRFLPFRLVGREEVSRDTRVFRFATSSRFRPFGVPVGKHVYVKVPVGGRELQRAYTPISPPDTIGYFELLIKVYFAGSNPKYPAGGAVSQYIDRLRIGDTSIGAGPCGALHIRRRWGLHHRIGARNAPLVCKSVQHDRWGHGHLSYVADPARGENASRLTPRRFICCMRIALRWTS